jgi:uroporphyrin-3 C-methyltransferase
VRVQNLQKPELPLLTPDQAYYAHENLKLRLLSARLSLLAHDEKSYKADLQLAQAWLKRYYDGQDKSVKATNALLLQLAGSSVSVNVPDIAGSLAAVRSFKPAADKAAR